MSTDITASERAPTSAQLAALADGLPTLSPDVDIAETIGETEETVAEWQRRGSLEVRRLRAEGPPWREEERPYVTFWRLTAHLNTFGMVPVVRDHQMGRPTSCTPKVVTRVLEELLKGVSLYGAAGAAGVSPQTLYRWQKEGQQILYDIDLGERSWESLSSMEHNIAIYAIQVGAVEGVVERSAVEAIMAVIRGARDEGGALIVDDFGRPVMAPDGKLALRWLEKRFPKPYRGMDAQGDDESASVRAARAEAEEQPITIVVQQSESATRQDSRLLNGEEDAPEIEEKSLLPPGRDVPEPDYIEEIEDDEQG